MLSEKSFLSRTIDRPTMMSLGERMGRQSVVVPPGRSASRQAAASLTNLKLVMGNEISEGMTMVSRTIEKRLLGGGHFWEPL